MIKNRKPAWLRKRLSSSGESIRVSRLLSDNGLDTVCRGAKCPNIFECFDRGTATFLIMGDKCTRNCGFCAMSNAFTGTPMSGFAQPSYDEPERVAEAIKKLGLKHAVITSVTRDDLPDGGARHFANTIIAIQKQNPGTTVEILTPDFNGDFSVLSAFKNAAPDIFNHNLETVPRLYSIRPGASYNKSLSLLLTFKELFPSVLTKSGIMAGLGETQDEILSVLRDLRENKCDYITIGQYLNPSERHEPIKEYIPPERFAFYKEFAESLGFKAVSCGPYVRSSYMAEEMMAV